MTRKLLSPMGEEEFVRVKLGQVGERLVAAPLSRGAGVIMSMVRADGLVRIPRFSEGVHAGAEVEVELLRGLDEIRRTVIAIGSHDLALDLLSNALARRVAWRVAGVGQRRQPGRPAGARARRSPSRGLAPAGRGDRRLQRQLHPAAPGRSLGRPGPPGRPRPGPDRSAWQPQGPVESAPTWPAPTSQFVNRQRGSGTRVLLDYHLRQLGIAPSAIPGYTREEFTHLAVAAAVASGAADTGLAILAAARALEQEFIPLFSEQYQLVIPRHHYESALLAPLLDILRGRDFRQTVNALGGYDTRNGRSGLAKLCRCRAPVRRCLNAG